MQYLQSMHSLYVNPVPLTFWVLLLKIYQTDKKSSCMHVCFFTLIRSLILIKDQSIMLYVYTEQTELTASHFFNLNIPLCLC